MIQLNNDPGKPFVRNSQKGKPMKNFLPKARTEKIIFRELEDESVYYDLDRLEAGSVNAIGTKILEHCDGNRTAAQIAARIGYDEISESDVFFVLEKLDEARLLEPGYRNQKSAIETTTRRAMIGTLAIGSIIASIPVPAAAQGASCFGEGVPCNPEGSLCCPGLSCQQENGNYVCRIDHQSGTLGRNAFCNPNNDLCGPGLTCRREGNSNTFHCKP